MSSRSLIRYIIIAVAVIFIIAGVKIASMYNEIYGPNVNTPGKEDFLLYIPTGSDYNDVIALLEENHIIKDRKTFDWAAGKKNYAENIHPGRYRIRQNMSNNQLLDMLRSGLQEPVNVVINVARTPEDLATKIATQIEAGKDDMMILMNDEAYLLTLGFNKETIIGMFIPNTYEFWWNTDARDFFTRMKKEYDRFWNRERSGRAGEMKFSPNEIITLASIIISETNKEDEYRRIAGVYINRLNKGMRLQADPTVKFALGDFERQRILKADTYIDSPYNTYMYAGLPPGPIAIPPVKAIDAVLKYEKHDYLYFCAKEDFSGYHSFARTLDQHNRNARLYQKALNRRKILK
ncbi:MAG: endolytic transglycosylase MltG [Bacteroidales bacterium]|nr:endolytic transglycosylase MltG [Bacteroidales bacterium]